MITVLLSRPNTGASREYTRYDPRGVGQGLGTQRNTQEWLFCIDGSIFPVTPRPRRQRSAMRHQLSLAVLAAFWLFGGYGCSGAIESGTGSTGEIEALPHRPRPSEAQDVPKTPETPGSGPSMPPSVGIPAGGTSPFIAPKSGARRLSRDEYDNSVRDLLGDTTRSGRSYLPGDTFTPFDNEYSFQETSPGLIEGVELLAEEAAGRLLGDAKKRAALVGCTPSGPADAACLRAFVSRFGRRALRRPLSEAEIDGYMRLQKHAITAGDFFVGVGLVIRAFLQDPQFLYRIEFGTPEPGRAGVMKLGPVEVASL
jgi:hypothetical protein